MGQMILAFEIKGDKRRRLQQVCDELQIILVDVLPVEYEQQLGALAGIDGFTRKPGKSRLEAFGSEMLVLSGINSQILDKFLAECGRKNVGKIALRAVLTPQNIFWTPEQLHKELQKGYLFHAGI